MRADSSMLPLLWDTGQNDEDGLDWFHRTWSGCSAYFDNRTICNASTSALLRRNKQTRDWWHFTRMHLLCQRQRWAIKKQMVCHAAAELFMTLTTGAPAPLIVSQDEICVLHAENIYRLPQTQHEKARVGIRFSNVKSWLLETIQKHLNCFMIIQTAQDSTIISKTRAFLAELIF